MRLEVEDGRVVIKDPGYDVGAYLTARYAIETREEVLSGYRITFPQPTTIELPRGKGTVVIMGAESVRVADITGCLTAPAHRPRAPRR